MRSSIESAKIRPRSDYGSDHELLIAKFRLKLKKVGKTTRPFRYDLKALTLKIDDMQILASKFLIEIFKEKIQIHICFGNLCKNS